MTKVYSFKINDDFKKFYTFYLNEIPLNLKNNIFKFRYIYDQYRSLAGKLLIRFALFQEGYYYDVLPRIKRDIYNRPYLNKKIDFNITHSGDYVVCCITNNGQLGVDIERMGQIEIELYSSFFTESEIKKIDNQLDMFYCLWTQKEAVSKAIGQGLGVNWKGILIEGNIGFFGTEFWNLKSIEIEENYMFHLACKDNSEPEFHKVYNSDLIIKEFISSTTKI